MDSKADTATSRKEPMAKTSLKRLDNKPNDMIEGSDGPIIFPFAKIEDDFLRVHRGQLVHHNSEIAILVARKSKFNVSVKSRKDLKETGVPDKSTSLTSTAASGRHPKEYHPMDEYIMVDEDDAALPIETDEEKELKPTKGMTRMKACMMLRKMCNLGKDKPLRNARTPSEETVKQVYKALEPYEKCFGPEDELLMPDESPSHPPSITRDPPGIHIPKASVKHYLQWQFDKLAQQMEDEERSTQSDISVYNINQSSDPDALGVGEEALKFHRTAHNLGETEFADRFLLLVGHCILNLMKKHDFLMLDLDDVQHILSSDYFGVPKERNVLRAAYAWLQFEPEKRKHYTPVLMGAVRFGLLTKKEQLKCLMHNNDLLTILLNVPPFQRTFMKSCLWSYAMDTGLTTQFQDFEDQPRINYKQFFTAYRRPGRPRVSSARGMPSPSITPPMQDYGPSPTSGNATAVYGLPPDCHIYCANDASVSSNANGAFPTSNSYSVDPCAGNYGISQSSIENDVASSSNGPDASPTTPNFIIDYRPTKIGKKFKRGKGKNGFVAQHIGTSTIVTNQKQTVVLESKTKPTTNFKV